MEMFTDNRRTDNKNDAYPAKFQYHYVLMLQNVPKGNAYQ